MLMLLLACADPADDPGVAAVLELEGVVVDGGLVFAANCQACHGEDAEFIETILYGGFGQMGAYEDILEDQEIADVMAWLHDR
jgi:mono/diheme cytochrome c family protein